MERSIALSLRELSRKAKDIAGPLSALVIGAAAAGGCTPDHSASAKQPVATIASESASSTVERDRQIKAAKERFYQLKSYMENSKNPHVRQLADDIALLRNSPGQFEMVDFSIRRPAGTVIIAGPPESAMFFISRRSLTEGRLTDEDWAVHLKEKMAMHKLISDAQDKGQTLDYWNLPQSESKIWDQTWAILGEELGSKVSDDFLKKSWQAYKAASSTQ